MGPQRTENNSLSLSLAEAEELARGLASQGRKKQRSTSGVSKWFPRMSSRSKTISQQGTGTSADDVIRVNSTSSSIESSPQPENSSDSLSRSSGSDSGSRNRNEIGENVTATLEIVGPSGSQDSHERGLTPVSIDSTEFESGTDEEFTTSGQTNSSRSRMWPSNSSDSLEGVPVTRLGGDSSTAESASGSNLRERQTSIMHASNLTREDEGAAARAREVASNKRRQRMHTDELTNDIGEWLVMSARV